MCRFPSLAWAVPLLLLLAVWGSTAGAAAGGDDGRADPKAPRATPQMEKEIRELAPLLESDDLAARQATAERIVAMGEGALPVFEAEMRRRHMAPNGQVKLVLLRLRALREERRWSEAIAKIAAGPRQIAFTLSADGRSAGKVVLRTEPLEGDRLALEVTIDAAAGSGRAPQSASGTSARRVSAVLHRDRTFSPRSVQVSAGSGSGAAAGAGVGEGGTSGATGPAPGGASGGASEGAAGGSVEIQGGRAKGRLGNREIDVPAPPPLALDWALPLVVEAMPRVAETELVFGLFSSEGQSTEGLLSLKCLGEQPASGGSKGRAVTLFELRGVEGTAAAALPVRRFEIDERGRFRRAELGGGRTLEDGSPPRK